jgi:hypothetical protein
MWQWRSEHNYLEKEQNLSSIVICYNVLHSSQKATPALVLECYVLTPHNCTEIVKYVACTSDLFMSASQQALPYLLVQIHSSKLMQ